MSDPVNDEIKSRAPIEQVAARYTELKRAGSQLKGLSPFTQEKTPSFVITPEKQFFKCFSSGLSGDIFTLVMEKEGVVFPEAKRLICEWFAIDIEKPPPPKKRLRVDKLREEAIKIPRSRYLSGRGLHVPPGLDWHPNVAYYQGPEIVGHYQAMLAPVMRGDEFLTYHVTYIEDGKKAPVDPARKILPAHGSIKGASVPLYEPAKVMGVAEGIETAIAATMLTRIPVWSVLSTSGMKSWIPPAIARHVVIFADHDKSLAGHAAAYALGNRLWGKKITVEVRVPEEIGTDWNDVLTAEKLVEFPVDAFPGDPYRVRP